MNRTQLEHVVRSAGSIVGEQRILIIGSQSILASLGEDELPPEVTLSNEADVAFFDDPDEEKSDLIDSTIGEQSGRRPLQGPQLLRSTGQGPGRRHRDAA